AQVFDNFSLSHVSVLENKFYDEFNYDQANNALKKSALNNKGWYCQNNASAGYFTDGALNIPADCNAAQVGYQTQGARGALGWNDYSVEADVTFAAGELTNAVYAGVSGRHNDVVGVSPSGYEIALFIKTDGTSGMRIYARGGAGELASCDLAIARGTAYNVKVIFQGNTIYAYLDGALKLTVTDSTYPIGFAGIRYIGNAAGVGIVTTIDNFVVYDYDEAPPATPAKYEDFESYTPSYLDDGVTYDKSYIQTAGWGSVSNASLVNYVPYFDNGVLTVPTQHSTTEDYNLVMVNNTKMKNLENYSVSYDVKALTNTATATYLYLSGRDTDYKNGYFARLWMQAGVIRGVALYKNVNGTRTMFGTQYAYAAGSRFNVLEQFTVKISFSGDTIEVYVNSDTPVVTVTDDTYTKGTIGVHAFTKSTALGSACEVDNITVYDYDNSAVYTKEIVGDVNLDSTVNSDDVSAIIGNMLNDVGEPDLNKDGSFDIADVVRLKRIIVSL
ncbi:MAG: hypothetical protein J6T73_05885, partial [Clostridia bacterium]|nr:hypothetical protein [Clostridia bacterium]